MTTQLLKLKQQKVPQTSSTLAIIFFLLGMPNFYAALRHRSQNRKLAMSFFPVKGMFLFAIATGGTFSLLMF